MDKAEKPLAKPDGVGRADAEDDEDPWKGSVHVAVDAGEAVCSEQ